MDKNSVENTLYELLVGQSDVEKTIVKDVVENVDLIPSNVNLSGAEIELVGIDNKEYILKEITDKIKDNYDYIIIDEAQDLSKAQILVISRLVSDETKSISVIADAAQRIYKSGFTWSEVGLNVRGGRTIELKKNYRNTVQIVKAALSLLEKENDKSDFTTVETARSGDEKPIVGYFENKNEQNLYLLKSLNQLKANNNISSTVVLHRSRSGLNEIQSFLEGNGYDTQILLDSGEIDFERESIKICTLSSVKGLEFDNVFIIDLNDDILPYPPGFNGEDDELHISTERRLLYTSMTRARERLYLLSSGEPSRYLTEIDENLLVKADN